MGFDVQINKTVFFFLPKFIKLLITLEQYENSLLQRTYTVLVYVVNKIKTKSALEAQNTKHGSVHTNLVKFTGS